MTETCQFLAKHSLVIVFGAVFVEQLGLPLPALPWLLAAGALAASGKFNLFFGLALTIVACLAADGLWFYLGRHRGSQMLGLLSRFSSQVHPYVRRTRDACSKHGLKGVLVSKFLPVMSTVAAPVAGMCGIKASRFFLIDGIGSLLYCGSSLGIGYLFSHQVEQIREGMARIGGRVLIVIIGAAILYVAYRYWQRNRLLRELRIFAESGIDRVIRPLSKGGRFDSPHRGERN